METPELTSTSENQSCKHPLRLLLDLHANSLDGKFANDLLDHKNVDMKMLKQILDIAMPAICKNSFKISAAQEKLSDVLTLSEEAFAFLVLENCLQRWMFIAKQNQVDNGHSLEGLDKGKEDTYKFGILPPYRYQVNCKTKNSNKPGRWTSKGHLRYNELLQLVQHQREARSKGTFEDDLMEMYNNELNVEINKKYNVDNLVDCKVIPFKGNIVKDETTKSVMVMNMLTFTSL